MAHPQEGDVPRWRSSQRPSLQWEDPPTGTGTPSSTVSNETTWAITPSAGASETYSRGDHTHGSPAQPQGGGTPSDTVVTETGFGQNSTAGAASTYSRGDHTHGTPADPVPTHAALATGIHGVGNSTVESASGAQGKVDAHKDLTTGVHGAGASTLATAANVATHAALTGSVHGFDASGNAPAQTHDNTRHTAAFLLASEKAAASGVASLNSSSKVVQDCANAQTPSAHDQAATTITSGTFDGDRLPALSSTKKGGAPATGTPSGKYLKDDGTWATPASGGGGSVDSQGGRVFASSLSTSNTGTALTNGTAYFVYLGKLGADVTIKSVEFWVSTVGAGAQTAEVGLFSTPLGPNKAAQSVTKIVATGTVDSLTATGMKRNTSTLNQVVTAGTHLWAGIRTAMATTQPTIFGRWGDFAEGYMLRTASSGALTGAGPWTGAIVTAAAGWSGPDLRATLD